MRLSSTVTKALGILDLFLIHKEGLSLTQISNLKKINMSTAVRLCATLEQNLYLKRNARSIYFIGSKIDKLAHIYRQQFNKEEIILPVLTALRDETGESASFYVVDGKERVCLVRVDSKHEIRHVVEEGTRLPLTQGVVGPVLLAFVGTKGTKFDMIRKDGFLNSEGRESFTASVAVPVFTCDNYLAGALVVSGLSSRFDAAKRKKAIELLTKASVELHEQLPLPEKRR